MLKSQLLSLLLPVPPIKFLPVKLEHPVKKNVFLFGSLETEADMAHKVVRGTAGSFVDLYPSKIPDNFPDCCHSAPGRQEALVTVIRRFFHL
jgi:hypothetical protein